MLAEYAIASAFMVSVVCVPILAHFSLDIPPSLEEQFLQFLVQAIFSLVLLKFIFFLCQRTALSKLLFLFS